MPNGVRVYKFGLLPPVQNGDLVVEQMFKAHCYQNVLTEIELERRRRNREALACPEYLAAKQAGDEATGRALDGDDPHWLDDPAFHASHRAALLAKDPEWYGQFGWSEEPKINYVWPTPVA